MRSKSGGTNFHSHSHYSFLDGCSTCAQICDRAMELGFRYVCISDHGNVAGHIEMYDEARSRGLVPVLGCEMYHRDEKYDNGKRKGFHLTLWAVNETGLHNLWAISSNAYYGTGDGHRNPDASWDDFDGLGDGVVCTSACLASALDVAARNDDEDMALYFAERLSSTFEDFYIELHTNSMDEQRRVNMWLADFARRHGYKTVYAVDSHYANEGDAEFHDMWLGCQTKAFYDEDHWKMAHEYYMQGEDEVSERLSYLGEDEVRKCFDGIDDFLSKVEEYELDTSHKVPRYQLPDGWSDSGEYLKWLVARGLLTKVGGCEIEGNLPDDPPNKIRYRVVDRSKFLSIGSYIEQLERDEFPLILGHGLSDYFLIVADYCRWAKGRMLMGPGRGSCAASVLCYVLDITEVDPMGKGLVFSRFLNEGRMSSLPDIDEDFPDHEQGKHIVHEYLVEKYGSEYVTAVGVTTFFGVKLALKEVCRYYRVPIGDANRLTSLVEELEEVAADGDWKSHIDELEDDDRQFVYNYLTQFPDLFAKAERMVGLARQSGKHAAGYVISPEPLAKILPIRKSSNDEIISQFDKVAVERMGFLKADILGLRNLTTLEMAARLVKERHGVEIDYYHLVDDPVDDATWELFGSGKTLGVFQLEGRGITGVAMELRPRSVKDLSAIVALYRPGVIHAKMPDGTGMLEEYIARSKGEKPVTYLHPLLEPILSETYGVIVYQEQCMRIFTDLAGFTDEQADHIRSAIGKKKIAKMMAEKPRYISGCIEHGVSEDVALQIWSQVEASASYSFNLAHSLCYATISFWTAHMKAHYPIEYYAACMSTVSFEKATLYMREARRSGIDIVPPKVSSLSDSYSIVSDGEIAFGLSNVKGVGVKAAESILNGMPYESFEDFVDRSGVNSSVVKVLIRAGAFREMYPNRADLLHRYETGDFRANLFGGALDVDSRIDDEVPDYDEAEIMAIETDVLGLSLTVDQFDKYRKALGPLVDTIEEMDDVSSAGYDTAHVLLVKVLSVRQYMAKGGMMAFLKFQTDADEEFECTCFAKMYAASQQFLKVGSFMRVEVVKQKYKGGASYVLNKVQRL